MGTFKILDWVQGPDSADPNSAPVRDHPAEKMDNGRINPWMHDCDGRSPSAWQWMAPNWQIGQVHVHRALSLHVPKKTIPLKKNLDIYDFIDIVHSMNQPSENSRSEVSDYQIQQFQTLVTKLFQCCQERAQYQCERFQLPDAELRCLLLFGEERYLTSKGIAYKWTWLKAGLPKSLTDWWRKN